MTGSFGDTSADVIARLLNRYWIATGSLLDRFWIVTRPLHLTYVKTTQPKAQIGPKAGLSTYTAAEFGKL